MPTHFLFTRLSIVLTLLFAGLGLNAQVLGPSVTEVKFSYTATFQAPEDNDLQDDEALANFHASHIFGIFTSPTIISKLVGVNAVTGGVGGPRTQMKIKILSSDVADGLVTIKYSNSGKMVLNSKAAKKLIAKGTLNLPLPTNPYEIYDEKCTDEHYNSFGDFWYFYDPFRKGCEYLSKEPMATKVEIKITENEYKKLDLTPKLPQLRGDNANGNLFSIYIISGYYEDGSDKEDPGFENFNEIRDTFSDMGFKVKSKGIKTTKPLNIYTKSIELDNGKVIDVEVKHLLIDTGIETKSKVFAKFFKEAVEQGDLIVYGGHSGLGANLDIPSLEEKAGAFKFDPKKKQVFFFDSCSSYSYYLEHFAVEKTKSKIDIITNGLSSYFHTSGGVLFALMDRMLSEKSEDVLWIDILNDMENTLDGDTYLLNVGGI
ncbi:MAG: hypothetical protein ABL930_08265 [Pseudobdellovibrio sp.]